MLSTKEVFELLTFLSETEEHDAVWWTSNHEGKLTFLVNCNDFFAWGCADAEEIENQQDIDAFEQAYRDCLKIDQFTTYWWKLLYCARKRGSRPQGAQYSRIPKELHPLFDACGPPRAIDYGNPYTPEGEYRYSSSLYSKVTEKTTRFWYKIRKLLKSLGN